MWSFFLLVGHPQHDLRAGTDRRTDLGGAAVAFHPVNNAATHPVPVLGNGLGVEAMAPILHEHLDAGGRGLGVHVDPAGARMFGGVGHRLAGSP